MQIIRARKLGFDYIRINDSEETEERVSAIRQIDLDVERGDFIAILGHNGSGKSTLAKHINALLTPSSGTMWIDGIDTAEEKELWKIRQKAGMVFQNPDNQIIGTVVDEDVAFGPENLGVPTEDIWVRVEDALTKVGMLGFRDRSPNRLSGGQKQRVAIAGVVAMRPECIVLDEPTAMLDPTGRREVLEVVRELNEKENVTVILITHYMEEVVFADRVYVMDSGDLVMSGTPREIFSRYDDLRRLRLSVPQVTELAYELKQSGLSIPDGILTVAEFTEAVGSLRKEAAAGITAEVSSEDGQEKDAAEEGTCLLSLEDVGYTYGSGTVYEVMALEHINLRISAGEFIGVIGHTGSGKSTLIQHFNGLIRPTSGRVLYRGADIWAKGFKLRDLRTHVGLVFQYPENQLFETDVLKDVMFGPKNQGLSEAECEARAKEALISCGVEEKTFSASPFELSGGQKRRVAIAGVLAMNPEVLILDEPTAGLDPAGRDEILMQIRKLHRERGITVILVSHSMEDVAEYADRLLVVHDGKVVYDDAPKEVFRHYKALERMGLAAPQITYCMRGLREAGLDVDAAASTVAEAKKTILAAFGQK